MVYELRKQIFDSSQHYCTDTERGGEDIRGNNWQYKGA
jgi:hypothetical protein